MHSAEQARSPGVRIYDPFAGKNDLTWLTDRVQEGYFGPTASYDRSPAYQARFELSTLSRISSRKADYHDLLTGKKTRTVKLEKNADGAEEKQVPWTKDLELMQLKKEWETLPKGGEEELDWVERAVALSVAGFEEYRHAKGSPDFVMRDNQIYYMTALLLNKGTYEFGKLETDVRGIELPTGEGKTYCFGLSAPIFGLQEETEPVVVVEPSYLSAQNHAGQMAEFYDDFFHQSMGVAVSVPEKEGFATKRIADEHGVFADMVVPTGGMQSYRSMNGQLVEDKGMDGRQKAWKQQIVYIDPDSLAFDWLTDHQIGGTMKSGQPELSRMTLLVAEADDQMLDKARNPYITSEVMKGEAAWDDIGDIGGFEALYPDSWTKESRHATTQRAMFTIWGNLYEAKRKGYFKEGYGKDFDYMVINRQLVDSERLTFKASNIVAKNLSTTFGYEESAEEERVSDLMRGWTSLDVQDKAGWENAIEQVRAVYRFSGKESEDKLRKLFAHGQKNLLADRIVDALRDDHQVTVWRAVSDIINSKDIYTPEEIEAKLGFLTDANREALTELSGWINNNSDVIDAALHSLFGMQNQVDFIGAEKPVLLDEYGFPLEKRQLHDMQQVFLQLHNSWQQEHMEGKALTPQLLLEMEEKYAPSVEISRTTSRITLPALLERCKKVRFSSGSLLPAASSFSDLYGAEVLAVSRHLDIPDQVPPDKKTAVLTKCLDGGLAQVDFLGSNPDRISELQRRAEEIRKGGRMGLFIVSDISVAEALRQAIPGAEIATGAEELQTRGSLDKATSEGEPGKVIITTWIAHRDIDVKMTPEVVENGGLDCVVSGIPPTERGLWQALQRSLRGDQPGTRSLLLTPSDFAPLRNRDLLTGPSGGLFHRPVEKTHAEAVHKLEKTWESALKGDRSAMQSLFKDYLQHLRGREEVMKQQLMRTMIRDSDLEKWQQLFVEEKGRLSEESVEYMRQVEAEARTRLGPVPISTMQSISAVRAQVPPQTEAVLKRLESRFGYVASESALIHRTMNEVREGDLREGWADFLRFLELDVYTFLTDQQIQKLKPDGQRAMFRAHIDDLLKQKEPELN